MAETRKGNPILSLFEAFNENLNKERLKTEEVKIIVDELEKVARQMTTILQGMHKTTVSLNVSTLTDAVHIIMLKEVKPLHDRLYQKVTESDFYRYHEHWRFVTQRLVFIACICEFLTSGKLLTWVEAANKIFLSTERYGAQTLYLDLEDYLHGILLVANELARLAVNSVTRADYVMPCRIAAYLNNLDAGFRLLNLKNDSLRRRMDSLKYDLKKVEEVVYDISLRGYTSQEATKLC